MINFQKDHSSKKDNSQFISYQPKKDKILETRGCLVKFGNYPYLLTLKSQKSYGLLLYLPYNQIKNFVETSIDLKGTMKLIDYINKNGLDNISKIVDGQRYIKIERLIKSIISPDFVLLQEGLPFDILTSNFTIIDVIICIIIISNICSQLYIAPKDKGKVIFDKILDANELKIHEKYLYGKKSRFLTKLQIGSNIIIVRSHLININFIFLIENT